MNKKIIVNHKEYKMPNMGADTYMDYLDISEKVSSHPERGYVREEIELMCEFIVRAYDNQFTAEELKNVKEGGHDIAAIIIEFMAIDAAIGEEVGKRMEKIQKNFTSGK